MADSVNIHDAKTHLSRLLARVRRGAVITIAKAGTPIARLVPVGRSAGPPPAAGPGVAPDGLPAGDRAARLRRFLTQEVWTLVPQHEAGRVLTREEEDALLGYGEHGA
jgi:prevent-host-death family protein